MFSLNQSLSAIYFVKSIHVICYARPKKRSNNKGASMCVTATMEQLVISEFVYQDTMQFHLLVSFVFFFLWCITIFVCIDFILVSIHLVMLLFDVIDIHSKLIRITFLCIYIDTSVQRCCMVIEIARFPMEIAKLNCFRRNVESIPKYEFTWKKGTCSKTVNATKDKHDVKS